MPRRSCWLHWTSWGGALVGSNGIIISERFGASDQFERIFKIFCRHLFELSTPFSLLGLHFNAWLASWSCIDGIDRHQSGWLLWSQLEAVDLPDHRYGSLMFVNHLLDFFFQLLFLIVNMRVLVFFLWGRRNDLFRYADPFSEQFSCGESTERREHIRNSLSSSELLLCIVNKFGFARQSQKWLKVAIKGLTSLPLHLTLRLCPTIGVRQTLVFHCDGCFAFVFSRPMVLPIAILYLAAELTFFDCMSAVFPCDSGNTTNLQWKYYLRLTLLEFLTPLRTPISFHLQPFLRHAFSFASRISRTILLQLLSDPLLTVLRRFADVILNTLYH